MNPNSNQKIQFPKEMGSTTEFQKLALQRLTIPIKSAQDPVESIFKERDTEKREEEYQRQIGKMQMEIEWLKKKCKQLGI